MGHTGDTGGIPASRDSSGHTAPQYFVRLTYGGVSGCPTVVFVISNAQVCVEELADYVAVLKQHWEWNAHVSAA